MTLEVTDSLTGLKKYNITFFKLKRCVVVTFTLCATSTNDSKTMNIKAANIFLQ